MKSKNLEKLPVEVRYVPLPKEEAAERQKKFAQLLVLGAIKYSKTLPEDPPKNP